MPGNLVQAAPNGVMPASLCTAFTELREFAQLQNQFHDGTVQRSQLAQTSRRTFRLVNISDTGVTAGGVRIGVPAQVKPVVDKLVNEQVAAMQQRVRNDPIIEQNARREWAK